MERDEFEQKARLVAAKISGEMAIAAYNLTEERDPTKPASHMIDKFDYIYRWVYRRIVNDDYHNSILEEDSFGYKIPD